ncbi:MAG: 1-phosphofructokinase family hexose kinase [Clostridia bacterium]|nr:1-phosphofructokinase family hexose kinase [Clostridia bacterium]
MNPSYDRTMEVAGMHLGETNRVLSSQSVPGGKGINVSIALDILGQSSICIGLAGEKNRSQFDRMLKEMHLHGDFLSIPGEIRTNIKIIDRDQTRLVTELNEPGPEVDEKTLRHLTDLLLSYRSSISMLVLTGSLPPKAPADYYRQVIAKMQKHGIPCVLDASGEALKEGLKASPFLVKPNRSELEQLEGTQFCSPQEIAACAMKYVKSGVQMMAVSLGKEGALIAGADGVFQAKGVKVKTLTTVGAGDFMVAGLIDGYLRTHNSQEALKIGSAMAAMRITSLTPDREEAEARIKDIEVSPIDKFPKELSGAGE